MKKNSSTDLPGHHMELAKKAFKNASQKLHGGESTVFLIGESKTQTVRVFLLKNAPASTFRERELFAKMLQEKVAERKSDFFMFASCIYFRTNSDGKNPPKTEERVAFIVETPQGQWMSSCLEDDFFAGKVKEMPELKQVAKADDEENKMGGTFAGIVCKPKERQIDRSQIQFFFGPDSDATIKNSSSLRTAALILHHELQANPKRTDQLHKLYIEFCKRFNKVIGVEMPFGFSPTYAFTGAIDLGVCDEIVQEGAETIADNELISPVILSIVVQYAMIRGKMKIENPQDRRILEDLRREVHEIVLIWLSSSPNIRSSLDS